MKEDSPLRVGLWRLPAVPSGWEWLEGEGCRSKRRPFSSVLLGGDSLAPGQRLVDYVENQQRIVKDRFEAHDMAEFATLGLKDADEEMAFECFVPGGRSGIRQRQFYARIGSVVGIATVTMAEEDRAVVAAIASVLQGLSIDRASGG